MKTIFKYDLMEKQFKLTLPIGSEILSAINQYERIKVYALINELIVEKEEFIFHVFGTGNPAISNYKNEKLKFLNTVILEGGMLVFHVFYFKVE